MTSGTDAVEAQGSIASPRAARQAEVDVETGPPEEASSGLREGGVKALWVRIRRMVYLSETEEEDSDTGEPKLSIPDNHAVVNVPERQAGRGPMCTWLKKLSAFIGPGYMVAVGYMDPGNWQTDLAGGAQFKYSLLFVVLVSSLLAIFLQTLASKLGIVTNKDLAQHCRLAFPAWVNKLLWVSAEIAIAATDLAEVIGSAIALQLLIGVPLVAGVCVTALDVLLLLGLLGGTRVRALEAVVATLIFLIIIAFGVEVVLSHPPVADVMQGFFVPDATLVTNSAKLYIAMGIVGATIMPHNLYLHSSIVQTRKIEDTTQAKREAICFSNVDTVVALILALFVNAAILMVSAAAFYNPEGATPSIADAYHLLAPTLGTRCASIFFGIALLASGQNSTLTGTMAGQIVMEGFVNVRLKPWLRRLFTRLTVIVPAVITVIVAGERGTNVLLTLSQVILSIQLPFAVVPLVYFTSTKHFMGQHFVNRRLTVVVGVMAAVIFVCLNGWLLLQMIIDAAKGK